MTVQQAIPVEKIAQEVQSLLEQQATATPHPRPLVLVPGYFACTQTGRWPLYGGDAAGMDCIRLVGGSPFSLPSTPLIEGDPLDILTDDAAFAEAFEVIWSFIEQVDIRGVYLCGGNDLFSCLYGQSPMAQTEEPDLWRDLWERYALFFAWLLRWPTLGVCRGMQHMNTALGGGLIQDLRAEWRELWTPYARQFQFEIPPLQRHRAQGKRATPETFSPHPIIVDPASRLAKLVQLGGTGTAQSPLQIEAVLSMHHQAVGFVLPNREIVGSVAAEHRVGAIAHDGVIEALEATGKRFWLALQFHPEWSSELAWARGIFGGFVQACRDYTPLSHAQLEELKPAIRSWVRAHDQAFDGWSTIQGHMAGHVATQAQSRGALHLPANEAISGSCSPDLPNTHRKNHTQETREVGVATRTEKERAVR